MQNVKRNRIWSSASSEPFPSPAPSLGPKRYGKAWGDDRSPKRPRRSTGADWPAQEWASESMGMNLDEASTLVTPRSSSPSSSTPSHSLSDGLTELHSLADAALGSALTSPEQDGTTPMDWVVTHHRGIENGDARTICYGAICGAKARFQPPSEMTRLLSRETSFSLLRVVRSGSHYALCTRASKIVAHLDLHTSRALGSLGSLADLKFAGLVESAAITQSRKEPQSKGVMQLSVNVYGPFSSADQVGKALSAVSAFLQHPFFLEPGCNEYFNPQMFRTGNEMQNLTHLVGLTEKDLRAKAISDEVEHIFDSLNDIVPLDHLGPEPEILPPAALQTELTSHQVTALRFIQQRENQNHCQTMHARLRGLIQLPPLSNIPSYSTGGILADVMGLGKTLTMISAILSTLDASQQYVGTHDADEASLKTRATLIVVSSVQVLDVWETEIKKHVKAGTLKTCRFHGKRRPTSPTDLTSYDVVLTTYGVLSAEYRRRSAQVLHQLEWYRVVLDEAHWIRNNTTDQFKAAVNLRSLRRWCLTGTPIQNTLGDFVSLLSFLHFEPFSSHAVFHRHILKPLCKDTQNGGLGLRELLRTICLRRDERLLKLPEPCFEQHSVALHEEERALYDQILTQCDRDIDHAVSSRVKIKKYGILFKAIMKLRRLCNHGTFISSTGATDAGGHGSELESEQGCDFCSGTDEDKLELIRQGDVCSQCGRPLSPTADTRGGSVTRPVPMAGDINSLSPKTPSPQTPTYGISTKLQAVVNRLDMVEDGSKSLVFSYWTATLDLLEKCLKNNGTKCLRIDGNVGFAARLRILNEFRHTDVPVLLMTVQTGAVGLNLTAANYVHIVEPQWNPSVEEQAIARAVRMGQTRRVTVIRYVVKNSVEENIVHLQKRKRNLAKFTLDGAAEDGASGRLDDLRFVLDLDLIK